MCVYVCVYMYMCMFMNLCDFVHKCVCVCVCVCVSLHTRQAAPDSLINLGRRRSPFALTLLQEEVLLGERSHRATPPHTEEEENHINKREEALKYGQPIQTVQETY